MNQFDGDVWVEDNEPTGSVFVVKLPIHDPTQLCRQAVSVFFPGSVEDFSIWHIFL